jgi:hypothetical protein
VPDLSRPDHLPNLRPNRQPPDKSWLPRQRRGTTPQMVGRYPDYNVFDAASKWDAATRKVVDRRMRLGERGLTFFDAAQSATLHAFCDVVTAQDGEPRVPVAEMVDEMLSAGRLDGYQYADMPDDGQTWRIVLRGLDETTHERYAGRDFSVLDDERRKAIVSQLAEGSLNGGSWDAINVKRAFSICMRAVLAAFYSHPWAWNEIGFGGPAYPRGYMRLGPMAVREPHEKPEATKEDPVSVISQDGT